MLDITVSVAKNGKKRADRQVLELFRSRVKECALEAQLRVVGVESADGNGESATVHVGGFIYTGVTEQNAGFVFDEYVLDLVRGSAS